MEMRYPWMVYVSIGVIFVLALIPIFRRKDKFKKGKKVANAVLIKEMPYFKNVLLRFKILRFFLFGALLCSMAFCLLMFSRPSRTEVTVTEIHNRDIILCMDISDSMDEVNLEICDELEELVRNLEGERFGVSIFNGKSVLLVPLTTDYDYVVRILEQLKESFSQNIDRQSLFYDYDDFDYYTYWYKYEGTLCDWGSSFIGDGLASALFSFNDLEENPDRTRLLIFTTDNELNGTPIVTVEEATRLCKNHNVPVFAVVPDRVVEEESFRRNILSTGGDYFKASDRNAISDLADVIRATDSSVITEEKVQIIDEPQYFFLGLLIMVGITCVLIKGVRE